MDNELLLLDLHSESPHPKHERLKSHFVNQLLAGRLNPGEVIPTEQHLVKVLRVARTTVRQAMASLENDGLIRRGRGKGTFVEEDALTKLRRGQEIFALVVPETRTGFYPSLLHGFAAASGDSHFQTMICNSDNDVMRQADIVLQLLEKEVGGVAIVPTSESPTPAYQVRQLQKRGIPVVFCHRRVDGIAAPLLAIPFRQVGELAGETLAEHGHRRAAFFTSLRSPYTMAYFEGFQRGLQRGGGEVPPELQYWVHHLRGRRERRCVRAGNNVRHHESSLGNLRHIRFTGRNGLSPAASAGVASAGRRLARRLRRRVAWWTTNPPFDFRGR